MYAVAKIATNLKAGRNSRNEDAGLFFIRRDSYDGFAALKIPRDYRPCSYFTIITDR